DHVAQRTFVGSEAHRTVERETLATAARATVGGVDVGTDRSGAALAARLGISEHRGAAGGTEGVRFRRDGLAADPATVGVDDLQEAAAQRSPERVAHERGL